jgi:dihydrofolate reductase
MMRKLILSEHISMDGVIQAPGGPEEDTSGGLKHGGWSMPYGDEVLGEHIMSSIRKIDALLLGRRTYEIFAGYWPAAEAEAPDIANPFNKAQKYVASRSLESGPWEPTTVIRDVPAEVPRIKEQPGQDIMVWGSADLAQTLMKHNLIDEYQLYVYPVVIGSGKRLFRESAEVSGLKLTNSLITADGVAILTYEPAPVPAAVSSQR